jgi:hypothetical protein
VPRENITRAILALILSGIIAATTLILFSDRLDELGRVDACRRGSCRGSRLLSRVSRPIAQLTVQAAFEVLGEVLPAPPVRRFVLRGAAAEDLPTPSQPSAPHSNGHTFAALSSAIGLIGVAHSFSPSRLCPNLNFAAFAPHAHFRRCSISLTSAWRKPLGNAVAVECPHYTAGGAFHHDLDVLRADVDVSWRPVWYLLKSAHVASSQRIDRRMSMSCFFSSRLMHVPNMFSPSTRVNNTYWAIAF